MSPVEWKYKGNKWAHHHHQFFSPPMTVSVFMSKPSENLCIYDLCQYLKQSLNIDASILAPISAAFDLIAVRDESHSKLIYKSSLIRPINRIINHSQFDGITCEITHTHTRTKNECLEIGDWSMWYAPAFFRLNSVTFSISFQFPYRVHIEMMPEKAGGSRLTQTLMQNSDINPATSAECIRNVCVGSHVKLVLIDYKFTFWICH